MGIGNEEGMRYNCRSPRLQAGSALGGEFIFPCQYCPINWKMPFGRHLMFRTRQKSDKKQAVPTATPSPSGASGKMRPVYCVAVGFLLGWAALALRLDWFSFTLTIDAPETLGSPQINATVPPGPAPPGMVWIPGGTFWMGQDDPQFQDAQPVHKVYVDGFWMDRTEVANRQFQQFVNATAYVTLAERKS